MADPWLRAARERGILGAGMSRRTLLGGASALGAGLAGLAVAGCGDSDEEARTPTAAATPTQPGQSPAPAATAAIPEEFVITMEREPVDLMPFFGGFDQVIAMRAINETLVHVTMRQAGDSGRATVSYDGMLAESWQHPEPTVWLFKLRDGVKFHDGTPWDAPAAVANFDAFRDTAAVQALRKQFFGGRFIAGVGAVDERTLRIETTTPLVEEEFFGFGFYLGFTATSPAVLANGGFQAAGERPTGTGPYRFQAWRKGQDIILVRNEDYWGSLPNMRRLKFIWRPEASVRAQTVKAGESHFAFNIGAEQASALEKSVVGGGFQSNTLRLNNTKAPTSDVRVRQAINYALDREAINKAIFKGLATPIGFFAYQPVDVPIWPYDPARARALLSQAGAAGREVELVYGESRIPEEDQLAEIFAAQIGAVGLKVKLTKVERAQYNEISAAEFTRQPELLMETTSSGNYGEIASSLLDKYGCSGSGTFCSPEWDRKFGTLLNMAGPQRLDTISDIARRLQEEETPRAWVLAVNQVHGLGRNVRAGLPLNVYVRVGDLGFV